MYPFRPKSTAHLKAGHYWAFTLKDGCYACGVVIARRRKGQSVDPRIFLAGLLDWSGSAVPKPEEIRGLALKERGYAHIKAITENGGDIIGEITPCWNYDSEVDHTNAILTWGYGVIRVYAEEHFAKKG